MDEKVKCFGGTSFYVMISRRSREWRIAWQVLAILTGDDDRLGMHPVSGQVWQYMGTEPVGDGGWHHHFRHRMHPSRPIEAPYSRLRVPATLNWQPRFPAEKKKQRLRIVKT